MQTKLKSNWMGRSDKAPTLFRAASNGKPFTRTEKIRNILKEREHKENRSLCKEMILSERNRVKEEMDRRDKVMQGLTARLSNPNVKLQKGKNGVFIQPRNENGHFLPKVNL